MSYSNFDEIKRRLMNHGKPIKCAIVSANTESVMEAAMRAYNDGFIYPVFIGNEEYINNYIHDFEHSKIEVIDISDPEKAMECAVTLAKENKVQCIMKGLIETSQFMRAVLKRENDLKTGEQVSMISIRSIPNYHKLVCMTDPGICPHPTLEQKKMIIENAVKIYSMMGIDNPKVAVLCAAEKVNSKLPESEDAYALKQMNINGEISGCIVEGPISIDLAINKHSAEVKGYQSPVAGDADILLFHDMTSANIASKLMAFSTKEPAGVLLVGTKIPVIVNSRSSSAETKYLCIMLATACFINKE